MKKENLNFKKTCLLLVDIFNLYFYGMLLKLLVPYCLLFVLCSAQDNNLPSFPSQWYEFLDTSYFTSFR